MNQNTNLVLVSFLEDQPEGETFPRSRNNGWPFHITLVPWFGVLAQDKLDDALDGVAKRWKTFMIEVGPEKMFGENLDVPVNVVKDQAIIKRLHDDLLTIILSAGQLLDPRWTGDNYHAHITQHLGTKDNHQVGEAWTIDHLYLVKLLDDDHCQFLKKYPFGDSYETAA